MQRIVFSGTVLAVAMFHAAAYGSVLLTTGDFGVFSATTASYIANAYNDRTPAPIHLWTEQSGLALPSDVTLDTSLENYTKQYTTGSPSATRARFLPASGPTITAGTAVDVYFVYFDPRSDSAAGSVTFDTPVSGIVAYNSTLPASDFLRVPGAPYPANPAFIERGMEGADWAQLSADGHTLTSSP